MEALLRGLLKSLLLSIFLDFSRLPTPHFLLLHLLHLLKPIEELIEHLSITRDILHVRLQFLALAVLHEEQLPLGGIAYREYLLLLCLRLRPVNFDLLLLNHVEDALLHETDPLARFLPLLRLLDKVLDLRVDLRVTTQELGRERLPRGVLFVLVRIEIVLELLELIVEVAS